MRLLQLTFTLLLATATLSLTGCSKEATNDLSEPKIAVTYAALDGCWQLTHWQGSTLDEATYLYIEFDRSTRRYTMWDNIDSMYATDTTGTFTVTEERDGSYTLTGTYDHGVGDWNYAYRVTLHSEGEEMEWLSRDEAQWMEFRRIDSVPELY